MAVITEAQYEESSPPPTKTKKDKAVRHWCSTAGWGVCTVCSTEAAGGVWACGCVGVQCAVLAWGAVCGALVLRRGGACVWRRRRRRGRGRRGRRREQREEARRGVVGSATCLRACYAMSGTELAYGAMRSA
eukprot:3933499-Rhodomonas_salina.1